jgi:hypothetical protein
MSDDDKKQQTKDVLYEYHEASENLTALKENARRIGKDIQQFGKWLETEPAEKIYVNTQQQYGLMTANRLDDKYALAVDFQKALILADEIRAATAKVKDLQESKTRLGLK